MAKSPRLLIWDFPDGGTLQVDLHGPTPVKEAIDFLEQWIAIKRSEMARYEARVAQEGQGNG